MSSPGLPPRAAAWRVLHDLHRAVPFELALRRGLEGLGEADRGLAHEIAAGVLRHRTTLDAALVPHLKSGTAGVRADLLDILRLGAYQLLFLQRVPQHAAVDTAVTLGRRIGGASVGGFINAVLRKVAHERESGIGNRESAALPTPDSRLPNPETLAAEYSHPEWLVRRWIARFGLEETERLLRANNTRPPLVIQPAGWSEDALLTTLDAQGIAWHRAPYQAGLVITGRRPQELPGLEAGAFVVQDPAQALVLRYAAIPPESRCFDACAAPGGKAVGLSLGTAFVAAADLRRTRLKRLRQNLRRAGGRAAVLLADAAAPPVRPCDAVLLDVPCLGTGAFARHPDARWRVTAEALAALSAQAALLLRAQADVVRPGGLLVFATCSLEPEENELQVEAFLAAQPEFRRAPPEGIPAELLTPAGDLALLPQRHGTDGAYAARLRRNG